MAATAAFLCSPQHFSHARTSEDHPIVAVLRGGRWEAGAKASFIQGLRASGFEEGRDYELVARSTDGDPAQLPGLIDELVALRPVAIVAQTTGIAVALKKATDAIPIIATLTNPVELGLTASIARPSGNVTGIIASSTSSAKLVELLREIIPTATRIGVLLNRSNTAHVVGFSRVVNDLAGSPIRLIPVDARAPQDIEPAFRSLINERVHAMYIGQDALFSQQMREIAELALAALLPTAYGFRILPDSGGLLSYGTSLIENARRFGQLTAKIIGGARPGDLPIEQQAKLEFVINMKTAAALGLTIPPLILARVDDIIEQ